MKVLYILVSFVAITQALPSIPGQDTSFKAEYNKMGAPKCTIENSGCILPDYDDNNYFYNCLGEGTPAIRQKCAEDLWFDFSLQVCQWPEEWTEHPRPPAKCSGLGTTQKPKPTKSTPNGSTQTTDNPGGVTDDEIILPTVPNVAPTAPTAANNDDANQAPSASPIKQND